MTSTNAAPVELEAVWWPDPQRVATRVGEYDCKAITLKNTGHGPMGWYDIIEIYYDDGRVTAHPAHHAEGWQFKERWNEGERAPETLQEPELGSSHPGRGV